MCGIAGIAGSRLSSSEPLESHCRAMAARLVHRGPDDQGVWLDPRGCMALAQTRLSIIDLSPAGHQPMESRDGRYVIVFNGEIFNFQDLRAALIRDGVDFRGHSDTEVLLELFAKEGTQCLNKVSGMFAFAVWDRVAETLVLARDPLGIKPLYYWHVGDRIAFASEVRSLLASDLGPRILDPEALYGYFLNGSVQEPSTLVQGVRALPPGHVLEFHSGKSVERAYWQLRFTHEISDPDEAVRLTSNALESAMERHFVSDVPVGIFLSGGIDSSALIALARRIGRKDIQTFCIGFDPLQYDESRVARETASHFGSQHHEKRLLSDEACELLAEFSTAIDQPSIDGFNTFVVARFARQNGVKVVLSGLGGDELFGSYPSFQVVPQLVRWHRRCRQVGAGQLMQLASRFAGGYGTYAKALRFLAGAGGINAAYQAVRSVFSPRDSSALVEWYVSHRFEGPRPHGDEPKVSGNRFGDAISACEITGYMRNQLLRDADVMSMKHGLELRVPFLDRGLVELLTRIAPEIRLRSNKQLLLDSVPEIPSWVRTRKKQGFVFPFAEWLETHWHDEFTALQRRAPIALPKWYHRWSLFALDKFLAINQIERSDSANGVPIRVPA
jgi:asparagine synthase (glutamine-hydrolysing)